MSVVVCCFVTLMLVHVGFALWTNCHRPAGVGEGTRLFMPLWPYLVVMLSGIKRRTLAMHAAAVLQTILFVSAFWLARNDGAWSRQLVSPVAIGLGLLAGHAIFGVSVLATHRSVRVATDHFFDLGPLWGFAVDSPRVLMQFISVSIAEETIYRAGLQPLAVQALGPLFGVVVVAIVFAGVHEHFFRNSPPQSAEFLAFALVLGALYLWTGSLILVIVIHAVRNIEIAFMERLADAEESGDADYARRESEFLGGELIEGLVVAAGPEMTLGWFELATQAESVNARNVPPRLLENA